MRFWPRFLALAALTVGLAHTAPALADDLRTDLEGIFNDVLDISLGSSPGAHGNHFRPDNVATSGRIISALTSFVGANVSSFPLSSTATGLTFDFSSGVPVPITTSAGPVFAERATTIGRGKLNAGANLSYLNLSRIRGVATEDIEFNFVHQDVVNPGLGDVSFEYDYITLDMNLNLKAVVAAAYATYGITDRIDVGVAIPIVSVSMDAKPWARMTSVTYTSSGAAQHFFGGTSEEPNLTYDSPALSSSATGLGDIAIRAKANLHRGEYTDWGALVEARLPTGNEDNFLGTGDAAVKLGLIASGRFGAINPHANLAYDIRTSDVDRDEIQLILGYDQKVTDNLTLAAEWMGGYEVGKEIDALKFPEPAVMSPEYENGVPTRPVQMVWPTNIPGYSRDNIVNASFGIKYAPSPKTLLLANVIFPLNTGGMRSDVIPTIGIEIQM